MYSEYLGKEYHEAIRKILFSVDNILLPDSMIDAEKNIGGMKFLLSRVFDKHGYNVAKIVDLRRYDTLVKASRYYLAGVICIAIRSRTKTPPFNVPKYASHNWEKKQEKCMAHGNQAIRELMLMG